MKNKIKLSSEGKGINNQNTKPNKSSTIHKQSSVSQNKNNEKQDLYKEVDEEFDKLFPKGVDKYVEFRLVGDDYDACTTEVKQFIHSQLDKAISNNNKAWEEKLSNYQPFDQEERRLYRSFINNLLKGE